jgi:hypothetical protein
MSAAWTSRPFVLCCGDKGKHGEEESHAHRLRYAISASMTCKTVLETPAELN